jgi:hypothetical protein
MATNTIVWIVIAVIAAVIVIAAPVWVGRNKQFSRRHAQAEETAARARASAGRGRRGTAAAGERRKAPHRGGLAPRRSPRAVVARGLAGPARRRRRGRTRDG